jgi:hypothetical protein
MEVKVKRPDEKYPTSLTDGDIIEICLEQLRDKCPSLSVDDDVESSV